MLFEEVLAKCNEESGVVVSTKLESEDRLGVSVNVVRDGVILAFDDSTMETSGRIVLNDTEAEKLIQDIQRARTLIKGE